MTERQEFRHITRLRVRWAEVDMQKIVFNGHYLTYFDTAVSDYWRALALPYEQGFTQLGGELFVKKATVEYHAPARYDDQLEIGMRCTNIGRSSMRFEGAIFRGHQLLITGELLYVFADPAARTSLPVPEPLRSLLTDFEAGQPVTELRVGSWAELEPLARQLRTEVFIEEQGIAREDEWDAADASAVHAVLCNRLGQPVATGRLLQAAPGVAQVGRMAVCHALRGSGLGAAVLRALQQAAAARGDRELVLHAQRSAEGFYRRLGYQPRGEPFDEVGIEHLEMVLALPAAAQMSSSKA